jgi:hypothetical protein
LADHQHPGILESRRYHGDAALLYDCDSLDLCRFHDSLDRRGGAVCAAVMLYPGKPQGESAAWPIDNADRKEYVCHKVDKRLSELVKKKQRQRAQRAAALEKKLARDGGLRNSKGEFVNVVMQPTLPKIMLDDEDVRETKSGMSRSKSQDTLNTFPSGGELPTADSMALS